MKNQTNLWPIAVVVAVFLVVGGSVGAVILNNKLEHEQQLELQGEKRREEIRRQAQAKEEESQREFQLELCLSQASEAYQKEWKDEAKYLGRTDGRLPEYNANLVEGRYKESKNDCYRQ